MKIAYLDFIYDEHDALEDIVIEMRKYADKDTCIDYVCMKKVSSLDYMSYEIIVLPELIKTVGEIEKKGYDAVIIGCCLDPCIDALREIYKRIVIVGPFEAATTIAKALGKTFSIIATRPKAREQYWDVVHRTGCVNMLASIRYLNLKVLELQSDKERLHNKMHFEIEHAIKDDLADVIVLACTMETGQYQKLQEEFRLPVIDPTIAALKYAEMMVAVRDVCNWHVSEVGTYETPPTDELNKFLDGKREILW